MSVLSGAADAVVCDACGRTPARPILVRRHVGLLVLQRFITVRVVACRPCGRGLIRKFTGKTLWQGWWGAISFFFNWFVLATNVRAWRRLGAIESPSLSGDLVMEPASGFGDVEAQPDSQPKRRSRLRIAGAVGFLGFLGIGLVASGWDATHHDHDGAHGAPAPEAMVDPLMSGSFTADDGSTANVRNATCTGKGEPVPGGYTHFDCLIVFADGNTDDVVVHLLPEGELFFISAQPSESSDLR